MTTPLNTKQILDAVERADIRKALRYYDGALKRAKQMGNYKLVEWFEQREAICIEQLKYLLRTK